MEYRKEIFKQDFLVLEYEKLGFIVNRGQFSGSTSLENIISVKSGKPFFNHVFQFNGKTILLFDYDNFLKQTYHCNNQSKSRLCILMKMDDFTEENRPLILKLLNKNSSISSEYLGLIITSQAVICKIGLNEIFLTPPGLQDKLRHWGLYGCRFEKENSIQFFIDFENTIINVLKGDYN